MKSNNDKLGGVEPFETNEAILMNLLEEFQEFEEDRNDDDRVNSLIRSLEAEISSSPCSTMAETAGSDSIEFGLTVDDFQEGSGCSGSSDSDEMGWFDVEKKVPCSPSDDMQWYVDSCDYEMDGLDGSGIWVGDYSQVCYGDALEDDGYISIWQENVYDSIMYD